MTYLEAALTLLKHADQAMSAEEITERAIARGLITPQGKTPAATMRARLYIHARSGNPPLITKEQRGGKSRAQRSTVRWAYGG